MKKLLFICIAVVFSFVASISPTSSSIKAKESIKTIDLEESIKMTENFINQAETVNERVIEVNKKIKSKLIVKLDKILSKSNKYNVDITSKFSASDFEVVAQDLPDGTIQYSLSKTDITTNEEMIVDRLELLNFVFDEKLKLKNTFEVKGELTDQGIVNSKLWIDGKVNNEITVNINNLLNDRSSSEVGDAIAQEQVEQVNGEIEDSKEFTGSGLADRWSCTQSCVASKGVNLLVLGVMGGLCVSVCNPAALAASAGLAGGACYACVNSFGIAGFSTVMNCWEKC